MYVKIKLKVTVMILLLLIGIPFSNIYASEQEPIHALLLYDGLAKGSSREGNVETMQRLLASYGIKVTQSTFDNYKKGGLAEYNKVIGIQNLDELSITNEDFINDLKIYKGDYLHIGTSIPSAVQVELNMVTNMLRDQFVKISMDQFSESRIHVKNMSYIVQAEGTFYGSIMSGNGDVRSPYGVRNDHFAYVPYYEQGNLSELAMSYVLKDWLDITRQGQTYLIFKEVYPFSDLKLLEKLADKLYDAGIPFMVSVRPVFMNVDYPAMHRYLETLKYVQSRSGSVLVNAPVVSSTASQDGLTLQTQMESFVDVLADYGIAPLGIGAEMYWSYDQQYAEYGMNFFDSSILFPNKDMRYWSRTDSSQPFASSLYSMQLDFLQQFDHNDTILQDLPMDSAITYDFSDNEVDMSKIVQTLNDSWITFADYRYGQHTVHTQANRIVSDNGLLTLNGQDVDLNDAYKNIGSEYAYTVEQEKSFAKLFNIQNNVFIVLIVVTLLIFGFLFIIGYRLYIRKYLNQRRK
ncbi:hypothetical protein PGLA_08930 [Paenibacillus glacialis]|uniref:DUF2334 domain-containing protein n=2 Tax=Paenibacillus glacialis TaxID=494026 RepID=A0A168LGI4_9BACL|nr:hypothetical protein PGLA_08930 [Paenibacillus glacialis]